MTEPNTQTSALEQRISKLFGCLDAWRHFPSYQLERRADIFFSLYLREVIEQEFGIPLVDEVIPELPIKKDGNRRSWKADYFLCSRDHSVAYLTELKTDPASRRTKQDHYLQQTAKAGIGTLLQNLREIISGSEEKAKYYHLLRELESIGLLRLPSDLQGHLFPTPRRGLSAKLREIALTGNAPKLEVLYVQPRRDEDCNSIDFECFAKHVARYPDPLSQRFSQSLVRWQRTAGLLESSDDNPEFPSQA